MEHWKPIGGYEGLYEVSDKGRVRSLDRTVVRSDGQTRRYKGRILNPLTMKIGYKKVELCSKGSQETFLVHRLVAAAFIANPERKREVNHIDGDKTNNVVENLEWTSSSENHIHAYSTSLRSPRITKAIEARKRPVVCVETGKTYESATAAAKDVGGSHGAIVSVCKGHRKTHCGYHWSYC